MPQVTQIHTGPANATPAEFRVVTGHPDDPAEASPVVVTVHSGTDLTELYVVSAPWLGTHVFRTSGHGYYRRTESLGATPLPAVRAVLAVMDKREVGMEVAFQ